MFVYLFFSYYILQFHRISTTDSDDSIVRSTIESGVKEVRKVCCDCVTAIKNKKKPVDDFVATGIAHSQCKFHFNNIYFYYSIFHLFTRF